MHSLGSPLTVTLLGTQVYGDGQEDEMGTVGYFPSSLVEEQHVYQEATKEVPTTVSVSGLRAGQRRTHLGVMQSGVKNASCHLQDVWNYLQWRLLETGKLGRVFTPTLSVERVVNFLHPPPPFVFRYKLS